MALNKQKQPGFVDRVVKLISSKRFFLCIIAITVLQGLWYAVSFSGWINDEPKHFRTTEIYTQQLSPFFTHQPASWDNAGEVIRDGSYLFYYLMSWPLRLLQLVTPNHHLQLIGLRLIMIAVFVLGLVFYRRAMLATKKMSPALVHTALLLFVLTPAAGLLAGMLNYDNLVFLLFGMLLYWTMQVLTAPEVKARLLIAIVIVAELSALVKWSSIALVLPLLVFIAYDQVSRFGRKWMQLFVKGLRRLPTAIVLLLTLGFLIATAAIIERPVQNMLVYGKPEPSCDAVLSRERCLKNTDYYNYSQTLAHKDPHFTPLSLPAYVIRFWAPYMADKSANLIEQGAATRLPIVTALFLAAAAISPLLLLVRWRQIAQHRVLSLLAFIIIFYAAVLILQEYGVYTKYGIPGAIRTRYLVPVLVPYLCLVLYCLWPFARKFRSAAIGVLIISLILLLQGGSIVTHLFTTPRHVYLSPTSYQLNHTLKQALDPVVYGNQ